MTITIALEAPQHAATIETLGDAGFGKDRHTLTAYKLRNGVEPDKDLCLVALDADEIVGTIRFWPVSIGDTPALLLGPITVAPSHRGSGVGGMLINEGLERARKNGHSIVLLVGDEPYYQRFGFKRALAESLTLPGPVDDARFLAQELVAGALDGVMGMVGRKYDSSNHF